MTYSHLISIIESNKKQIPIETTSNSFFVEANAVEPYIPPKFSKLDDFPNESPSIILVSAMGASGKTTTARAISFDTGLPVLDLAKNDAVGDKTLTGTITDSYPVERIGEVLNGLQHGTCGVIVDGIDEARSKTTEGSFEAFLGDLHRLSSGSNTTSILILGRSQVLLDVWCHLRVAGADVGIIQIDPFDIEQAKKYIDSHARRDGDNSQRKSYEGARDRVLDTLGRAFTVDRSDREFLSFVGYPPVLDAIGTLLRTEQKNYFRIHQQVLGEGHVGNVAAGLLVRICNFLLDREHDDKAVPNFIETMVKGLPGETVIRSTLYNKDEQCARILATALSRPFQSSISWGDDISDSQRNELDTEYNSKAEQWLAVHPFFKEDKNTIRNPVFAAVATMYCMLSDRSEYQTLAHDYAIVHSPTYHLLSIMEHVVSDRKIGVKTFNMLIQSSSDLLSLDADIGVEVTGQSWQDNDLAEASDVDLSISIILKGRETVYSFSGIITDGDQLVIGPYVMNTTVIVPIPVHLMHASRVTVIGECYVSARLARIDTPELSVRAVPVKAGVANSGAANLILDVEHAEGRAKEALGDITIQCETHDLYFPLAGHVRRRVVEGTLDSKGDRTKYLRLKRILLEFAARGQGGLAKYRHKIENNRVVRRGGVGVAVLRSLIEEGVLIVDGQFYRLDRVRCGEVLGVSREQLRLGESSNRLREFLQKIR